MGIAGFLAHIDLEPILYGLFMFMGLTVLFWKFTTGRWLGLVIDIGVFWFVFSLHGESMTGGFAAMICAMLAGIVFPLMMRKRN